MFQHFCRRIVASLLTGYLLLAGPLPSSATTVFDDDFEGNSGGMPAGWSRLFGTGPVVEQGTTVTLGEATAILFDDHFDGNSGGMPAGWHRMLGSGSVVESGSVVWLLDSKVVIASDAFIDPSEGTVSINAQIAGVSGAARAGAGCGSGDLASHLGVLLGALDGEIMVIAENIQGGEQNYIAGHVDGYTGQPISLTLETTQTTFHIFTDDPYFDSGNIRYTAVFPSFTREDLGTAASLFLVNDVEPEELGSSSYDRLTALAVSATDDVIIASDETLDPSFETLRIETDFAGITGQGATGLITGSLFAASLFFCAIQSADGRIEVNAADAEGNLTWYDVGYLAGYTGGPIRLTVILEATSFSVSTDSPPFSSGPVEYATAFPGFTREDLGTAASVMLFDYGDPGASIIDRILVDVDGGVPVEKMSLGRVKVMYGG